MDGQKMEIEELVKFGVVMSKFHSNPTINALIVGLIMFGMAGLAWVVEQITEPVIKGVKKVSYAFGWPKTYEHSIEAVEMKDIWSGVVIENPGAPRNRVLLKAIRLYMTEHKIYAHHGASLEMHEKVSPITKNEEKNEDGTKKPPVFEFHTLPPLTDTEDVHPTYIEVAPGVQFLHTEEDVPSIKGTRFTYTFRSRRHDGNERIKAFIKKAFEWYKGYVKAKESEAKGIYLYLQHMALVNGKTINTNSWKRFRLSNRKSFDAFFHPEKLILLRLIDNFMNKTDKFSKAGFPDKLGLLLYGPPGTGKTTFIKCLAKYTNRNIVNINLARVKTNQELMEIMFSQRFNVVGEEDHVSLQHNQVIFVLEDIDAASNVVLKREGLGSTGATTAVKHSEKEKEKEKEKEPEVGDILKFLITASTKKPDSSDTLNLSGVLNALDGVVETPGRMVIMTTNYRGSLDPALIRPGRVNREIKLDYIKKEQAAEMIQYYYDTPVPEKLLKTFVDDRFTPAELEQFCSEHTTVEDLFRKLRVVISVQPQRTDPKTEG